MTRENSVYQPSIAIVGGGLAGLTAAWQLAKQGKKCTIFEAKDTFGGRVATAEKSGFPINLGIEFIDSKNEHPFMHRLVEELGIRDKMTDIKTGKGFDCYYADGQWMGREDIDRAAQPLITAMEEDYKWVLKNGHLNGNAERYDKKSISEFLKEKQSELGVDKVPDWLVKLISGAYVSENGPDATGQSCLNMLLQMSPEHKKYFRMLGGSDERFKMEGGNYTIIGALLDDIERMNKENGEPLVEFKPSCRLGGISKVGDGFQLKFFDESTKQPIVFKETRYFDYVDLAIPFTVLRKVKGIDSLGLTEEKLKSINELEYGKHTKIAVEISLDGWESARANMCNNQELNGTFYSDVSPINNFWISEPPTQGKAGVMTFLVGGEHANHQNLAQECMDAFAASVGLGAKGVFPDYPNALSSKNWGKDEFAYGSYSSPAPGQFTTLLKYAGHEECHGHLHFSGEHTEGSDYGFGNAAAKSGYRVAKALDSHIDKDMAHAKVASLKVEANKRAILPYQSSVGV